MCLWSAHSFAQSNRTWVSPSGDDANNCSHTNPCKTFSGALAKTNAGGEIVARDSGGFGQVTINKSVTINGGGNFAGIQAGSENNAITIQAASSDVVVLRGLTLSGLGSGSYGVRASTSYAVLHVENCAISNFVNGGISPGPTAAVFIQDTVISECGRGISLDWGGKAVIDHCRLENNGTGLYLLLGTQVTVSNTVASGNKNSGFEVDWGELNIESCVVSHNGTGIYSTVVPSPNGPSIVAVSNSVVTNNQNYGFRQSGTSVFYSRGNNTLRGNGTDVSGAITPLGGS
jgi:hypothetical protein